MNKINPNRTEKLTKKFLYTLKDGTVIKSNCWGPFQTVWQINHDNHGLIWEQVKELQLNNRLCHTFSSSDHLDAWEDQITNLPKKETLPLSGQNLGLCHHYTEDEIASSVKVSKPAKAEKSFFWSNLVKQLEEGSKDFEIADGVTEGQFEAAQKVIEEFWINFKDLGIQADHSSPYVSNLHLVLTITNVMMNICDDDPRLEREMGLAIYAFCKKILTIIQLSGDHGGLAQ